VGEVGEVHFESPAGAEEAKEVMHGAVMHGSVLSVLLPLTEDSTLIVYGLPQGIDGQQLKDLFASVAPVQSVSVASSADPDAASTHHPEQSAVGMSNFKGGGKSPGGTSAASDVEEESAGMLGNPRMCRNCEQLPCRWRQGRGWDSLCRRCKLQPRRD
jgi:hypothetical protein